MSRNFNPKRLMRALWEEIIHPQNSLGVSRVNMPQVAASDMTDLLTFLLSHGVTHHTDRVDATKLKPSQKEIDGDKARAFVSRGKPVVVSKDNYIIDGHHQWLSAYWLGQKVDVLRLSWDAKPLLRLVNQFPKTFHKNI